MDEPIINGYDEYSSYKSWSAINYFTELVGRGTFQKEGNYNSI